MNCKPYVLTETTEDLPTTPKDPGRLKKKQRLVQNTVRHRRHLFASPYVHQDKKPNETDCVENGARSILGQWSVCRFPPSHVYLDFRRKAQDLSPQPQYRWILPRAASRHCSQIPDAHRRVGGGEQGTSIYFNRARVAWIRACLHSRGRGRPLMSGRK